MPLCESWIHGSFIKDMLDLQKLHCSFMFTLLSEKRLSYNGIADRLDWRREEPAILILGE